jgi:hypothetical protein
MLHGKVKSETSDVKCQTAPKNNPRKKREWKMVKWRRGEFLLTSHVSRLTSEVSRLGGFAVLLDFEFPVALLVLIPLVLFVKDGHKSDNG